MKKLLDCFIKQNHYLGRNNVAEVALINKYNITGNFDDILNRIDRKKEL